MFAHFSACVREHHMFRHICGCTCHNKFLLVHSHVPESSIHRATPQPVSLLHASSLVFVFLFVWLTCHPQKMFASPRHSRLDTPAWSKPRLGSKTVRQFSSCLFIDHVLIRYLTQEEQGFSHRHYICLSVSSKGTCVKSGYVIFPESFWSKKNQSLNLLRHNVVVRACLKTREVHHTPLSWNSLSRIGPPHKKSPCVVGGL